ncbi:MAG: ribonuclease R [Flavobacteriales bacterium]|nr:ribonuclease R [Flavobacteriales bacterium]
MSKKKSFQLKVLKEWVVNALKTRNEPLNIKQISWEIGLKGSQYRKPILKAINELINQNFIIRSQKYKFQYNEPQNIISGIIDINKSGHGYVKVDAELKEIFIHRKNRLNSLHKDLVSIQLIKNKRQIIEGRVENVLKRTNTKFIGKIKIKQGSGNAFFIPNNQKIGSDFFIPQDRLNAAIDNDQVVVEFTDWPLSAGCPFGAVTKILQKNMDLKTVIESNIEISNIRNTFSKKIIKEVEALSTTINQKEIKKRRDFRKDITFTIDPIDAKDFDDAISIKYLPNKNVEIGVHIADVSHYVKSKSEIDKEAFLRSFSIYFPGNVIPMLPEKLSNVLCSLRPQEDKLSFSIAIEINNLYEIKSTWMGKGVINSNKRFSYEEAEEVIKTKKGEFYKELNLLNAIAKILRTHRVENGSIDFERRDIAFELNNKNEPVKIIQTNPLDTHKLVEEFMLLANKIVAKKLSSINTSIYRIHDVPDQEKIKELINYLEHFEKNKIKAPVSYKNSGQFINKLFKKPGKGVNKHILENLVLRAMAKAKYSTKNIGHYGLGFEKYTHFTSPIRRYADLMIHRLLNAHLNKQTVHFLDLETKCIYFSNTERIYIDLERKINKFIQLKLLENSIGQVFSGIISGVVKWGIYVEIDESKAEGLVSISDCQDDKYYYNENIRAFIGRRSGKKYNLGDRVLVGIKKINLFTNEMDLIFTK